MKGKVKIMLEKIQMWFFERRIRRLIKKKGVFVSYSNLEGKVFNGWFMPDGTETIIFIGENNQ